ncbi:ArnT family glycosyltransferase [Maribacter sp. CXY002]|uniref:ArnT family glycosyltransferase n=1 Tax=Maribacter luteocoastalis TaxID=3407671 RepID=UPI003B683245
MGNKLKPFEVFTALYNGLFNNSQLKNKAVFLFLSVITLFVRLPFFFRDYIDRDESTFILMGQSWVDGYLPYTQLWDLKPPLTFAFFAAIISIFGKSFVVIRVFGTVLVIVTSYFTYKIGLRISSKKIALWASLFCIFLLSLFGSLQGVMSEHICMAFFMPAIYLLVSKKENYWFLIAGVLMGISVMVKLNMAYAVLILGLYLMYDFVKSRQIASFLKISFYGLGIIFIILLTILPYYLNGQTIIWWKSVVLAPLKYTEARRFSVFKLAPTFILVGFFLFHSWKKKWVSFKNPAIIVLTLAIIGVLFSFLKGGRINGHYLIQLHPMLIILVVIVVEKLILFYKCKIPKTVLYLLLLIPMESYLEYGNIIKHKIEKGSFFNGEGFSVPSYIAKSNLERKNILFLGYHIGYWNLDTLPPTVASTHPSNICRDELFPFFDNPRTNSLEELKYIMESLQPKTVVVRKGRRVFDQLEIEANEYINQYLQDHYKVLATVDKADILQRLK